MTILGQQKDGETAKQISNYLKFSKGQTKVDMPFVYSK